MQEFTRIKMYLFFIFLSELSTYRYMTFFLSKLMYQYVLFLRKVITHLFLPFGVFQLIYFARKLVFALLILC